MLVNSWFLRTVAFLFIFQMFRKLHNSFTDVMCNPFHNPGDTIQSKWVLLKHNCNHSFLISQLQFQLLLTIHSPGPSMALYLEWWCKLADIPSYPSLRVPTVQNTPISPYLFVYMLPWSLKCKWIKLSCCTSLQVCHFTTNGAWDQSFISLFT